MSDFHRSSLKIDWLLLFWITNESTETENNYSSLHRELHWMWNSVCTCFSLKYSQAYEKGIALFRWPNVYDLWNTYLTKFIDRYVSYIISYSKSSQILKARFLPKRPSQTAQTLIRLLMRKQSDQGLPCLLFWQAFCEFLPWKPTFYSRTEKVFEILEHLLYIFITHILITQSTGLSQSKFGIN